MSSVLKTLVLFIAKMHDKLSDLLYFHFPSLNDKWLHFLVMGVFGTALALMTYPLIKWLVDRKMYLAITWIYFFSFMFVFTFAVEIGQKITGTGNMEFSDITYGLGGFLSMFLLAALIIKLTELLRRRRQMPEQEDTESLRTHK
ncbi:MAG: hypothetical protein II464_04065 [Oscillospiraceae bacterium]|nr:hypothetical protein [Oscillospiraceae bacterium]